MPKPRVPQAKAEVSGAAQHDPQRFKDRKVSKRTRPLGEPYAAMNEKQQSAWEELRAELPWLNSSHRPLVRLACVWMAKMDDDDFGVSATQALSSILSKLGATPVDETKVNHGGEDDEDPDDRFFGRPH
jgi:broad specificity phosphatase PhoE